MLHHVTLWFNRNICSLLPVQFPRLLMYDCTIKTTVHVVKVECFHHGKDTDNISRKKTSEKNNCTWHTGAKSNNVRDRCVKSEWEK